MSSPAATSAGSIRSAGCSRSGLLPSPAEAHSRTTPRPGRRLLQRHRFVSADPGNQAYGTDSTVELYTDDGRATPVWLREVSTVVPPASAMAASEHYLRMVRLLEHGIPVRVRIDLSSEFPEEPAAAFNILAEIPGTSDEGEVVLIGAHFDSWTCGTGATDDAAGSAVVMEAISEYLLDGHPVDWFRETSAVRAPRSPKPGYGRLNAYFNLDYGAGGIRGMFLMSDERLRPIFASWLEPFRDMRATDLSPGSPGGTDRVEFHLHGITAIPFQQGRYPFSGRTHHTNMDRFDSLPEEQMTQSAAILAAVAYHAAMRPDPLPRPPAHHL